MLLTLDEEIKSMVEKSLKDDLQNFGYKNTSDFEIDWSDSTEEGCGVEYKDTFIETASDIVVKEGENIVGVGWIDHIMTQDEKVYSYWTIFEKHKTSSIFETDFGIPDRVWNKLTEEDKIYLAKTHQGWSQDKKMHPYRKKIIRNQAEEQSVTLRNIHKSLEASKIPKDFSLSVFDEEVVKILSLSEKFLSGELLDPNISTETYILREQAENLNDEYIFEIVNALDELESTIRHAAIAVSNRASSI